MIQMGTLSDVLIRDARTEELDELARLLAAVYGAFRTHLPADAWKRYIGGIVDVRIRLGESELIVAGHAGRLIGPPAYTSGSASPRPRVRHRDRRDVHRPVAAAGRQLAGAGVPARPPGDLR